MKRVLFREEAAADLRAIMSYYQSVAPDSVGRIQADIARSLALLTEFPQIGPQVPSHGFRRIVTRKYQFRIAYQVGDEAIVILGIFRYQDRVA